ncbi:MAG: response regulator [Flavobacteriales bacterium]|jgi:DNA-binding NarL/FixJ family response regulator
MPIRVCIYDDNAERRESLRYLLGMYPEFEVCGTFENCTQALQDMESCKPDVVLMDIEMPGQSGIEGTRTIKQSHPLVQVLIQTVFEDGAKLFDSLKAGASGYLLKKSSPDAVITAIREVHAGGAPITPAMAVKMLGFFQQQPAGSANPYALTERERAVLTHLVDGMSYKMIADRERISYHTVNTHVRNIYEKLHVHSLGEAVSKALKERLLG